MYLSWEVFKLNRLSKNLGRLITVLPGRDEENDEMNSSRPSDLSYLKEEYQLILRIANFSGDIICMSEAL